jgi:hypothetical protein
LFLSVLLAEILNVHYPKLVEMHNYPPRNGHALKLNNWMTLNRKVLKKLKLNLCCITMEQLANCAPGVIERVLIMGTYTYHSRLIPERVAEASQTLFRDAHLLLKLLSYEEYCRRNRW